ncbi:hypothetical protein GCM10023082_61150 [Streptomyces tremellae]|uniref:LysR substrate-binding domain-containing protein n=1 Tax=Streptomyces tremellae TaxID=1124239 RepID=A0ABP7G7X9_9ACTN
MPGTTVALITGDSDDVAAAVLGDRVGVGFVEGPKPPRGLSTSPVGRDELTVIVHPGHPWARRGSGITPAELAATPLVSREHGSGTRQFLEQALRAHTGALLAPPLLALSSTTAVRTAVAEAVAPGVLSSLAVSSELRAGPLAAVPVTGLDLTRTLRVVHRAGTQLVGAAAGLAAVARTAGRDARR